MPNASSRMGSSPVLSIGESLIDLIVNDDAGRLEDAVAFVARPGGAPANVTVALARLGVPSAFSGVVGDDPFGRRLRDTLVGHGVDVSCVRATPERATTLAFAWKDPRGDGHFYLVRGADTLLSVADIEAAGVSGMATLVVGSVGLSAEPIRTAVVRATELAQSAAVPICFDVNLRPAVWPDLDTARTACEPVLQRVTLLKLSLDDTKHLFGAGDDPIAAIAMAWRATGSMTTTVVLTDGARGAWYAASPDAPVRYIPAFPVDAVEPTGAGDAFTAGLLSRLIASGWAMLTDDDLRYAAAAGALATTRRGALDGLPTAADLDRFLENHRG